MAATGDQLKGCSIPEKCFLHPQRLARREAYCQDDLGCICKVDNHLGTNALFSSECLLEECTSGHGRKLFLRDWLDSCRQVGKSGWDDMPWEWEPYLPNENEVLVGPTTYLNKPPEPTSSTTQASVSVVTSTAAVATSLLVTSLPLPLSTLATTPSAPSILSTAPNTSATSTTPETTPVPPEPIIITSRTPSPAAIAGIVTGILLLVFLCAGLGYFYWKAAKKAKQKNREVAILSDRVSGCGFQRYIDELLVDAGAESEAGKGVRRDAVPEVVEVDGREVSGVGFARAM